MSLDVEKLKLTRPELVAAYGYNIRSAHQEDCLTNVTDAATAKALWGIVDWLPQALYAAVLSDVDLGTLKAVALDLQHHLEKAGMERPKP